MIFKAKHHFFWYPFSKVAVKILMKKRFHSFNIIGDVADKGLPILLISNHNSWWDGLWSIYMNQKKYNRLFHFMVLEDQLRKNWIFNQIGGFSINKESRSMVETLKYTINLLTNNRNIVLMFPQGVLQSIYLHRFKFENGIERILKDKEEAIQVLFVANLVDYFSNPKPSVYMYLKEYCNAFTKDTIEEKYNEFFAECVENQQNLKH